MADIAELPLVRHRHVEVELDTGPVQVFVREAGDPGRPTILLLHGFPSASHQFRRLIDALGARYHLVAPDYPGFGHTDVPRGFVPTFDALAEVLEAFLVRIGLSRFTMYVFDFGAPVGFRVAARHPDWIEGLVVQNANAYEIGLSDAARATIDERPGVPGAEDRLRRLFEAAVTRGQYEGGTVDPELVAPDGWTLDQHFLDRPDRQAAQLALLLDYHSNVERYGGWQSWLRDHRPPTLVLWGRNDPFFLEAGARAYLGDVPDAEVHTFATGHFALEDHVHVIAPLVASFVDRHVSARHNGWEGRAHTGVRL